MATLPFFDNTAPAATSVPAVEITIGAGGESGGFGGLAAATASLVGGPGAPSWADHLVALSLCQGLAPRVDCVDLVIAHTATAPRASIGDSGRIRMGAVGELQDLFSGTVVAIENRSDGLRRYRLCSGSHTLAQGRLNQTVTNMSVREAIAFAADAFAVSVQARIGGSDGTLSQFAFDDSRSVWDHLSHLADLRGFSLWFDASDTFQVADRLEQGDTVQTFSYGQDILMMNLWQRSPHSGSVTVYGGARVDFTLRKQAGPNRTQGGQGAPQRIYRHGALQAQEDLAARAASATLLGHRMSTTGELLVSGSAALGPGRVIEVKDLPDGGGKFLIRVAHHNFDRREGWRTRLTVSVAGEVLSPSASPAGALGGLL